MKFNIKNSRARFEKPTKLIHELICVKNSFLPASIKNENGVVTMRSFCETWTEPTTPSINKKEDIGE